MATFWFQTHSIELFDFGMLGNIYYFAECPDGAACLACNSADSGKIGCTSPELDACILEVSLHPAWRVLHRPKKSEGAGLFSAVDFNRDASLLVTAALDGVRLYDIRQGKQIANLQIDPGTNKAINEKSARFVSNGEEEILLISSRKSGLSEWPIKRTSENSIQIGPPHPLDTMPDFS